jgi:aldose 1-epimerase
MTPKVERHEFGKSTDGQGVALYTLTNRHGLMAKVTTYGAILTELHVPDRDGKLEDVVLGFNRLEPYLAGHPAFGATIGRFANRIAGGRFTLDGREYRLAVNSGPNHIHGGVKGFDKQAWDGEAVPGSEPAVRLRYVSADGEEGYPGKLQVTLTYSLTDRDELKLEYRASTDRPTPVNLTNHSYFNLAGEGAGDILGHELWVAAERYTPSDMNLIPTGELRSVAGTPLDFRKPAPIGARIAELQSHPGGYDHNFVIDGGGKRLTLGARAREPRSGRTMELWTTEPGFQLYTANYLDGKLTSKRGVPYARYGGFCMEAQHYPDSVNRPEFPSVILRPGETYRQTTVYRFSTR